MNYKTPGVYVEEIVKFPPSVAQVETAIPAFIGYTEKATKKIDGDLNGKPFRITSMLEYQTYFGSAEKETTIGVTVHNVDTDSESITVTPPTSPSLFKMYYSMQMYFANGGGPCYIVSVGQYGGAPGTLVSFNLLNEGLSAIRKVDEPTLIVFPDATSLNSDGDFYSLYNNALTQCNELQDRFTIIDTYSDAEYTDDSNNDVYPDDALRDGINLGKDFLKYGAAYYPFLNTILDYVYDEDSIEVQGIDESLSALAAAVVDSIDLSELETLLSELVTTKESIEDASDDAGALAFKTDVIGNLESIIDYLKDVTDNINLLAEEASEATEGNISSLADTMSTWMDDPGNLEDIISNLYARLYKLQQDDTQAKLVNTLTSVTGNIYNLLGITDEADMTNNGIYTTLDNQMTAGELFTLRTEIDSFGAVVFPSLSDLKEDRNALYNQIKAEIGLLPIKLPPSATMAGVYARVDTNRGVWKAPANVGLNYVTEPSVQITHDDQRDLNVDTTAGKSINAIRAFTGKGILVWGARTLAGNDNEWRYISVRRFFNMAEESIKKATEQFVFEPNDKNTWVRVKAMIDNFLTLQWRAGALAGPTPDKAFYVSVGLGETMTAQDVLEGRMNVEIGMAVVRPAEFIILKFSHKMQEA